MSYDVDRFAAVTRDFVRGTLPDLITRGLDLLERHVDNASKPQVVINVTPSTSLDDVLGEVKSAIDSAYKTTNVGRERR